MTKEEIKNLLMKQGIAFDELEFNALFKSFLFLINDNNVFKQHKSLNELLISLYNNTKDYSETTYLLTCIDTIISNFNSYEDTNVSSNTFITFNNTITKGKYLSQVEKQKLIKWRNKFWHYSANDVNKYRVIKSKLTTILTNLINRSFKDENNKMFNIWPELHTNTALYEIAVYFNLCNEEYQHLVVTWFYDKSYFTNHKQIFLLFTLCMNYYTHLTKYQHEDVLKFNYPELKLKPLKNIRHKLAHSLIHKQTTVTEIKAELNSIYQSFYHFDLDKLMLLDKNTNFALSLMMFNNDLLNHYFKNDASCLNDEFYLMFTSSLKQSYLQTKTFNPKLTNWHEIILYLCKIYDVNFSCYLNRLVKLVPSFNLNMLARIKTKADLFTFMSFSKLDKTHNQELKSWLTSFIIHKVKNTSSVVL